MTGFQMTGFKLIAAAFALTAAMAMPASSQAQAATGMKVAMAMPMHADGKMVRSRCAKRVATVRSALVPGLMPSVLRTAT